LQARGEGYDFGWADEGPGFGEEDQDQPVLGLGVGGEGDFCVLRLYVSIFSSRLLFGSVVRVSPLMRPSTTALQLKLGAGCPTLTRLWVAIVC
jgi:hypothetical protein